jgi:hypothetical protein
MGAVTATPDRENSMAQQWIDDALDTVARNMRAAGFTPVGHRKNGRPIWPVFGGEESGDAAAQAAAKAAADAAAATEAAKAKAAADAKAASDARGFPEGTPLEQMTDAQQAAYWKFHSRKHEDAVKAYAGITPDQAKQFKDRSEKLEYDLASESEKKVADAKKAAAEEARGSLLPDVVAAKVDAAAARAGVSEEDLAKALEFADTSKLLGTDGKVDTDKVKAFVATIKPDTGTRRTGPSTRGHGNSSSNNGNGDGRGKATSVAEVRAEREAARAAKASTK